MITITYSLENIDTVVQEITKLLKNYKIFTFTGDIGAGKTTLIKKLLKHLGVTDVITSPTFNLLNIYNNKYYHFDLYRLKSDKDFFAQGFHELLSYPDSWFFIEWPEIILDNKEIAKEKICKINIEYINPDERKITLCNNEI